MGRYILRRIIQGLIVIIGVTVVVFVVTRMVGDPVKVMLPLESTLEQRAAFEKQLGLDRPIYIQFADFLEDISRLDFGDSLWQHRPAMDIVFEKLPFTFQLTAVGIGLAFVIAVPLGIIAALRPGGIVDRLTVFLSLLGLSVPQFWLGLLFIVIFAVQMHWLPTSGAGSPSHIIMPALTMALPALARIVMIVRSSMIDELNAQYVKTSFAKGLPFIRVVGVHALRNASLPVMTLAGWETIRALAGYSVVVETVFAWPGIGMTAIQAIEREDLILVQAIVFSVAIMVVLINIAMDFIYKLLDPRLKLA
ncbi:ABC transporter permease [Dethiosulfatarculus sandiegensis]|uniref:ABC transporter permease n=1 Tax=Dethiosulfatarculus sandiegensis TaxID=1429043 RepID=A0A0D2JER4_9BACT|nr:ABC transporter permease [Dethiosulfatarculus sandiegensis]KIX14136.1 ABC transporter permease [Dethiosulfatarculus sandiegensis]